MPLTPQEELELLQLEEEEYQESLANQNTPQPASVAPVDERPSWTDKLVNAPRDLLMGINAGIPFSDVARAGISAAKAGYNTLTDGGEFSQNYQNEQDKWYDAQAESFNRNPALMGTAALATGMGTGAAVKSLSNAGMGLIENISNVEAQSGGNGLEWAKENPKTAAASLLLPFAAKTEAPVDYVSKKARNAGDKLAEVAGGMGRTQKERTEILKNEALGKVVPGETGALLRDPEKVGVKWYDGPKKISERVRTYLEGKLGNKLDAAKEEAISIDPDSLAGRLQSQANNITNVQGAPVSSSLSVEAKKYKGMSNAKGPEYSDLVDELGRPILKSEGKPNTFRYPSKELFKDKTDVGDRINWSPLSTADDQKALKATYATLAEKGKEAIGDSVAQYDIKTRQVVNPEEVQSKISDFNKLNREYHLLAPVENKALAQQASVDGLTPAALRSQGAAVAGNAVGGPVAGMVAGLGLKAVKERGAAVAMGGTSLIEKAPPAFQKMLSEAFYNRGAGAMNVQHMLLMKSNPEYREHMKRSFNDQDTPSDLDAKE